MKYRLTVLIFLFFILSVYGQNTVHLKIISRGDGIHQPTISKSYRENNDKIDICYNWNNYIEEDSFKGKEYVGKQTIIVGKKGPEKICLFDKNDKLVSEQRIYRENPDSNEPMTCPPWTGQLKNEVLLGKNKDKRTT